jgi:hypothetical protein
VTAFEPATFGATVGRATIGTSRNARVCCGSCGAAVRASAAVSGPRGRTLSRSFQVCRARADRLSEGTAVSERTPVRRDPHCFFNAPSTNSAVGQVRFLRAAARLQTPALSTPATTFGETFCSRPARRPAHTRVKKALVLDARGAREMNPGTGPS